MRHNRRILLAMALGILMAGCASLPERVVREPTAAPANTDDTRLGRGIAPRTGANPGKSGIYALNNAQEAFAARVLLARAADRTLDVQYYIWHRDTTGQLLFEALWEAAERGVQVRLLLDDANTKGLDATITALDAHPNIQVRLFNPFAHRGFRLGDFATDFARVNRRMHNKSFTADDQVALVGGRNIGDEYFGADSSVGFRDLDVAAVGPVVREVSREFELYWNSASAYPAANILPAAAPGETARLREEWASARQQPEALRYMGAVADTPLVNQLLARKLALEWTIARVVADDPAKVLRPPEERELHMLPRLEEALGKPLRSLDIVSPYFVPGKDATAAFRQLSERGVKVRVLTNSLAATDVGPVHAGYAKYREELLRGGVRLYELKPTAGSKESKADAKRQDIAGSSGASLHAKTFAVDGRRIFVGSFNLDPRSARLNTEMGVVIESPRLAGLLVTAFDTTIPRESYEVSLAAGGHGLEWVDRDAAPEKIYTVEPESGALRRLWIDFLSILPIEWLL